MLLKKKTYIVSTYNNYEWITTRDTYSLLLLMYKYWRDGYRVWDYPMWFVKLVYKITGKGIMRGRTAMFELYIPGSDQITYHTPYMDMGGLSEADFWDGDETDKIQY
jgi:hypothetical protein